MPSKGYGKSGQGGTGKNASSGSKTGGGGGGGKNRGPGHGHGNKGKGGGFSGQPYGYNPFDLTISGAEKLYAKQLAEGYSLEQAMKSNPAETISYWDLIDDSVKATNTQANSNNSNNSNNNDMSTLDITNKQAVQDFVNQGYKTAFGDKRSAVFDPSIDGDADYWVEKIMEGAAGHAPGDLAGHLSASHEATNAIQNDPGGVDPTKSITSQYATNPWLQNFGGVGSGKTYESANKYGHATNSIQGISNKIGAALTAANTAAGTTDTNEGDNPSNPYLNRIYNTVSDTELGGGNNNNNNNNNNNDDDDTTNTPSYLTQDDLTSWWDALDKPWETNQNSKWDDFTDFMTALAPFMGGSGGGYGYPSMGYGGYAPGGVASANPYGNMMNFMNAFKSIGNTGTGTGSTLTTNSLST